MGGSGLDKLKAEAEAKKAMGRDAQSWRNYKNSEAANMGKLIDSGNGSMSIGGGINRYGEKRGDYLTMRGADGGLADRFKQGLGTSYQALQDKAMAQGDSVAAGLQRQQAQNYYNTGMGDLAQQSAAQQAQARNSLAMRGGLGGGARERLAGQGALAQMQGQQGLGRNLANQNLGISLQDEINKNNLLGKVGNVEQQIQANNIGTLSQDYANQNRFTGGMYGEDMRAYGAQKQAQAQAQANSGGK